MSVRRIGWLMRRQSARCKCGWPTDDQPNQPNQPDPLCRVVHRDRVLLVADVDAAVRLVAGGAGRPGWFGFSHRTGGWLVLVSGRFVGSLSTCTCCSTQGSHRISAAAIAAPPSTPSLTPIRPDEVMTHLMRQNTRMLPFRSCTSLYSARFWSTARRYRAWMSSRSASWRLGVVWLVLVGVDWCWLVCWSVLAGLLVAWLVAWWQGQRSAAASHVEPSCSLQRK